jgi:cell division protein FtsQ
MAVARRQGRRRLWVVVGVAGVIFVGFVGFAVLHSPLLVVRHVVVQGSSHASLATIETRGGLADRPLMISVNSGAVAVRLEKLPWVRTAVVSRQWPSTVRVTIVERTPVAQMATKAGWAVVDVSGRVLEAVPTQLPGLPGVEGLRVSGGRAVGQGRSEALTVAASLPQVLRPRVTAVGLTGGTQVELSLAGSMTAVLGPARDLGDKYESLVTVMSRVNLQGVKVIDVRVPEDPVLTRG